MDRVIANRNVSLLTDFAANAIKLKSHTHGNKRYYKAPGPMFVSVDDVIVLLAELLKEHK